MNLENLPKDLHNQLVNPRSRVDILAELIGYNQIPPTIEEFVHDPYYLGDVYGSTIYPIWEERLKDLYPDPIRTTNTFLSVSGAIGTGKTRFSTICTLYDYCKFSMIEDPYEFLRMDKTTKFTIRYFNVSLPKARDTFITPVMIAFQNSPYFQELHRRCKGPAHGVLFAPASQPKHALSECIISCVISEVNFFKPGMGRAIIDAVISRLESRMQLGIGYLPHVILDSSDTTEDSVLASFIHNSAYGKSMKNWTTTIWDAKRHLGIYFNKGEFEVYAGDSEIPPFIIGTKKIDRSLLDPDRIIICPNEVKDSFESNIELALQEKCGLSIRSVNNFIIDKDVVSSRFTLPLVTPEVLITDFYDQTPLMDQLPELFSVLPIERRLYIRVDMGVSHDHCGFAIVYYDGKVLNTSTMKYEDSYVVPIVFGISRIPGQETPINKVRDLILAINEVREVALVTTDQYQSTQLRQECSQAGIKTRLTSVDRTDTAYQNLKMLLMTGRCLICNNTKMKQELLDLKRFGRRIDHTSSGINSKDQADAVAGAIQSVFEDPEKYNVSKVQVGEVYKNVITNLATYKSVKNKNERLW